VPEVRRLVLAMTENEERRAFRFGWSVGRRAHQAIAARCHSTRRARKRGGPPIVPPAAPPATTRAVLTAAEGELVRPLLPPQRPTTGRPRHDHRMVLGGILWVVRTHGSWRDMPSDFGKGETAYRRDRLWQATGLWQRLLAVLGNDEREAPDEVSL
jgi:transposase